MNKSRKKQRLIAETFTELAVSTSDAEDVPSPSPSPERDAPPPPPPSPPQEVPVEQNADGATPTFVPQARARWRLAEWRLRLAERRWEKKHKTYVLSGKYSLWDVRSATSRVQARLLEADKELGEARAERAFWRGKWLRQRSFDRLWALYQKDPFDPMAIKLSQLALRRWTEPAPFPAWQSMWPGRGKNIYYQSAQQFGLAMTWGLTHVDNFKEPENPNESEKQAQSRVSAAAKAAHNTHFEEHHLRVIFENTVWGIGFRGAPRGDEEFEAAFADWREKRESAHAAC